MPTFFTFKLGEKIDSIMGANPGGLEACTLIKKAIESCNTANEESDAISDPGNA
ncbi:hypothetical protein BU17DRAFT_91567 [Hysterangium stoloniferum]|nr:hypothetical protein BU17DRAFT_91567 [Hysterangium stoloniferum]